MITRICPISDILEIDSRKNEVVLIKKHDNWTEYFMDTKQDVDNLISQLSQARDKTFKEL